MFVAALYSIDTLTQRYVYVYVRVCVYMILALRGRPVTSMCNG